MDMHANARNAYHVWPLLVPTSPGGGSCGVASVIFWGPYSLCFLSTRWPPSLDCASTLYSVGKSCLGVDFCLTRKVHFTCIVTKSFFERNISLLCGWRDILMEQIPLVDCRPISGVGAGRCYWLFRHQPLSRRKRCKPLSSIGIFMWCYWWI